MEQYRNLLLVCFLVFTNYGFCQTVGKSPWGDEDELGRLNLITEKSKSEILSKIEGGKTYDLSVEFFIGMPSWQAAGDPHYRMWMTHTPQGTVIDDPLNNGEEMNKKVSYSGSAVSMYTHSGTHIDAFVHFGLHGKVYNGYDADKHLGDRGWNKSAMETIPNIIARGVLLDIAGLKEMEMLPDGYYISDKDIEQAIDEQGVELQEGDVVLIRTGRMKVYEDAEKYMENPPGLGMSGAKYLADKGAMIIGADNLSLEAFPSQIDENYIPIHTYLLAEKGILIMELVYLEELAENEVYEFAFLGGPLKFRGADAAPIRPIAIPIK